MQLTNVLIPTYAQMLRGLSGWLDKAQKQLPQAEAEALLSARLAPDMYPLSSQVSFACFQAQEATYRLRGEPVSGALEQMAADGQNAAEQPGSIADAQSRISETLAFLNALDINTLDAGAERQMSLELPTGMIFDMTGEQYARDWALAQFYFHLMTAYAILRSQKIELGKADYVPHMFAYLRPGTMPQN
ncbi:hypothetical protein PsAD2_00174 [Pseudovibrio axinellae]|uniref:DUF1993 domain-containing protein n=1 Tax=Pseudovibrio axinellae TaxID=989403 RepID=A0A166BD91_9HYPH|nr:DUF1993 domain-containing protein [Pseudovibrio axinellae]KZL22148.1 hypothetical protein PsAD2_00174 [Pseudovibrio axinellae]SEQ53390.1 hypothetical protein SAMN05421798_10325 [Pseudovibrio axinellae]